MSTCVFNYYIHCWLINTARSKLSATFQDFFFYDIGRIKTPIVTTCYCGKTWLTLYFVWFGTIDLDWNGLWLKDLVLLCNASTSPGSGIQKQSLALAVRVKLIQHLKKSHLETKILFRFAWHKLERAPPCFHIKRCYLICSICGSHCVSSVSCCNLAWTMPQSSGVSFLNDSFFLNTFFWWTKHTDSPPCKD